MIKRFEGVLVILTYFGHVASAIGRYLLQSFTMALNDLKTRSMSVNSVYLSDGVSVDVTDELERRAIEAGLIVHELEYAARVAVPSVKPEKDDVVFKLKKKYLGNGDGYVHSFERDDRLERSLEGYSVYSLKQDPAALSFDDFCVMYIDCVVNLVPRTDDEEYSFFTFESAFNMTNYSPTESSTGFLYGVPLPFTDSKKDRYYDICRSFDDFSNDCKERIPGVIPYRAVVKPEVVGVNKKNRVIEVASPITTMFGKETVEVPFKMINNNFIGTYIGLPIKEGAVVRVVNDFKMKCKVFDAPFEPHFVEADKKEWEGRADIYTANIFMLHYYGLIDHNFTNAESNGMLAFWRDYINPCISIGGKKFITRPGVVPSGSINTCIGNTFRHLYTRRLFMWFIRRHNYKSDDCVTCRRLGVWETTEKELLVDQYCVGIMSDDFIGQRTNLSKLCVDFISIQFGHRTEYVETDEPEFLRIKWKGGLAYREPARMLGKLVHGTDDPACVLQALVSCAFMCMNNRETYDKLSSLYYVLRNQGHIPRPLDDPKIDYEDFYTLFPTYKCVQDFQRYTARTARDHADGLALGLKNMVSGHYYDILRQ